MSLLLILRAVLALLLISAAIADDPNGLFSEQDKVLDSGDKLKDGDFSLKLENDCKLLLYNHDTVLSILSSRTFRGGCSLRLSDTGVLYLVPEKFKIAWIQIFGEPSRKGRYALVLANGKLGIYGPSMWSSGNFSTDNDLNGLVRSSDDTNNVIYSPTVTVAKQDKDVVVAAHRNTYKLVVQPSCNLAVLRNRRKIWETKTQHVVADGECRMELRANGELFLGDLMAGGLADPVTYRVWGSGVTAEAESYICVVRSNGELVVYGLKKLIYGGSAGHEIEMVAGA